MIPDFKSIQERTDWIIEHANMFTAVKFKGRGKYERHEYKDRASAEADARRMANATGRPYLIYACAGIYDTYVAAIHPSKE